MIILTRKIPPGWFVRSTYFKPSSYNHFHEKMEPDETVENHCPAKSYMDHRDHASMQWIVKNNRRRFLRLADENPWKKRSRKR